MRSVTTTTDEPSSVTTQGETFSKEIEGNGISTEFHNILKKLRDLSDTPATAALKYGYTTTGPFTTHRTPNRHLYYTDGNLSTETQTDIESAIDAHSPKHKQCWHNSKIIANSIDDAVYTEGYAFNIIPVKHAWITINTNSPTIIEITNPFYEYIGCPITTETIQKHAPDGFLHSWLLSNRGFLKEISLKLDDDLMEDLSVIVSTPD